MKSRGTHTLKHLDTLPFLKGERSVSRGGNGEPLLWLITQQGPGRTPCHFHCQTHYTTEEDSPPLLSCPFSPAVMWRYPSTAGIDELGMSKWKAKRNVLNAHNIFSPHTITYAIVGKCIILLQKSNWKYRENTFKWEVLQFSLGTLEILTVNIYSQQQGELPNQLKYNKIEVV